MKGHIRERSPGHWAIVIDVPDPETGKRRRKWHSFRGTKREAQVECSIEHGADYGMSFPTWCVLAGVSISTGKRIIRSGRGPRITRPSPGRVIVRISDHHRWRAACSTHEPQKIPVAGG